MHQHWTDWTGTTPDHVHACMDVWLLPSGPRSLYHERAVYQLTVLPRNAELLLS